MADEKPLFGVHTLKDEYHESLRREMKSLCLYSVVQHNILVLKETHPLVYTSLAVLAHEHGRMALYEGIKIADAVASVGLPSPTTVNRIGGATIFSAPYGDNWFLENAPATDQQADE